MVLLYIFYFSWDSVCSAQENSGVFPTTCPRSKESEPCTVSTNPRKMSQYLFSVPPKPLAPDARSRAYFPCCLYYNKKADNTLQKSLYHIPLTTYCVCVHVDPAGAHRARISFSVIGPRKCSAEMSTVELGPISASVLTICCAAVGAAFLCCMCFYLCPRYSETRAGRAVPYNGGNVDPAEEGTIWPHKRMQRMMRENDTPPV